MSRLLPILTALIAIGCSKEAPPASPPHEHAHLEEEAEGALQRDVRTDRFATAVVCSVCHGNQPDSGVLRDQQGRGIAPFDLWRSSMMANAANDPFFRAALAAEVVVAPEERRAEVEARCLRCHAPMASEEKGRDKLAAADLDNDDDEDQEDLKALARDGVSCTLCHQILENDGRPESFDGGFVIGEDKEIFGPHDDQFGLPMNKVTEYWPVEGDHVLESNHCGTCHTQLLEGGAFELATFLEWRNSSFRDRQTCQDCHVPRTTDQGAPLRTRISGTSHEGDLLFLSPREPFGRHLFVGGNTLLPAILRDNAEELEVHAPRAAFERTIAANRVLLTEKTARLSIEELNRPAGELVFEVSVTNLSGHKFPSGHASRRAWLRVRVRDSAGNVVFASGECDEQGRLLGPGGVLPAESAGGPLHPHRSQITSAEQVQVWEAVLGDAKGKATFTSFGARGFAKDNRVLPKGWDPKHADAARTQPVGVGEDEDFVAGQDRIFFRVPFPEDENPFTVEVALLYQTLSARHAAELFAHDAPEIEKFRRMYEAADRSPEVLAQAFLVGADDQ